jgi:hypothetical protein
MNESLDMVLARKIIEPLANSGTPPEYGFHLFTVGLDDYLNVIDDEYLKDFVRNGGSAFKMVVEEYGGGKTHFLYSVRELAWKHDYIASYIVLSPERTPFHKLDAVYTAIVENLIYSQSAEELLSDYDRGIQALIEKWYHTKYQEFSAVKDGDELHTDLIHYANSLSSYDFTSYKNALKFAFLSLLNHQEEDFTTIIQWLKGENPPTTLLKKFGIFEKIDKSTAFKAIRSLVQWIKEMDYSGLVILLDEGENILNTRQKATLYQNLREIIDECGRINFKSTMWFYAVPDETFLDGREQIYEALKQRLSTVFDSEINPSGIKLYLDRSSIQPLDQLEQIGKKLADIYEVAYNYKFDSQILSQTVSNIAKAAYDKKLMTGYKRLFVQNIFKAFHLVRKKNGIVTSQEIGL